jgi:hypothetical protein
MKLDAAGVACSSAGRSLFARAELAPTSFCVRVSSSAEVKSTTPVRKVTRQALPACTYVSRAGSRNAR